MPPTRVWGIAAFTLSVHALLLATAWRAPPDRRPSQAAAVTLRLVPGAAPRQVVAAAALPAPAPAPAPARTSLQRAKRVRPDAPVPRRSEPVQAVVTAAAPAQVVVPAEVITGVAFGLPRIGLPGTPSSRWMNPPSTQDVAPAQTPAVLLAQMTRERAMREAARAQIVDAAQRTLIDASTAAAEGSCLLTIEADARLVCDDESLTQALAPREAALSGLLQAYHRMEPSASGLAVTFAQGRYQVSWDVVHSGVWRRADVNAPAF
ncbi:MAG: hypothetical protein ABI702_13955 [Burkholderiales bacterium]